MLPAEAQTTAAAFHTSNEEDTMREQPTQRVEQGRITQGAFGSPHGARWGAFLIQPVISGGPILKIIASDGQEDEDISQAWEHVSVSIMGKGKEQYGPTPTWEQMCWVKDQFWEDFEQVIQFHPPKAEYINFHPGVLHLWRNPRFPIPSVPTILIGPKLG